MTQVASDWALEICGVSAGYRPDLPILSGVTVRVAAGSLTVLIGPNGAGKSTLLKAIAGLVPKSAGHVRLAETDITGLRPDRMAEHGMAYMPQNRNVFAGLTVAENLDLALGRTGRAAETRRAALYERFPVLAAKRADRAGALSGGQRQFLALAMALATTPRIILMDEPSAGLAPIAAQAVLDNARALTRTGVSILLVEQNVRLALSLADHAYILAEGRNRIDGPAEVIGRDPRVAEIYLGKGQARHEA